MKTCTKCLRELDESLFLKAEAQCRYCILARHKAWRIRTGWASKARALYIKNKDKIARQQKSYQVKNLDKFRAYNKKSYQKRREKILSEQSERLKNDINFKIKARLRGRIWCALRASGRVQKKFKAFRKSEALLGCSINDFKIYLESRFEAGMSWENYGKAWHIDHIMPCAIFDLSKPEHQSRCFHFSNCQPMWAAKNISKSDNILTNQFALL